MPINLFDTHCHLDTQPFDADREAVFASAQANGVIQFLNPAFDLASSQRASALAASRSDVVCAVGVHPNDVGSLTAECLSEIEALAKSSGKVVAIGEVGLDYHWDRFPRPQQREGFLRQIELANGLHLPIIIHCRDAAKPAGAYADCLEILAAHATAQQPILLHSFAGSPAEARFAFERGWYIGVGGPITYKKAHELREIVTRAPLPQLVLETDAPYLTPEPHRGQRNEPAQVRLVAAKVAELRGMSLEEIAQATFTNAQRLFGLAG